MTGPLSHVTWIGGGSGSGKSTIARRLAVARGWPVYASDDVMADHAARTTPATAPLLARFAAMDMDDRWVTGSPQTMLDTFPWFQGEGFDLIEADLRLVDGPVIAEGFRLLPRCVRPLLGSPHAAVWLLPTPAFRRAAFDARGSWGARVERTSDPARAAANLLERDRLFTDHLRTETARLGLQAIDVDTTMSEDDLAAEVTAALAL